ncbi:sporulation integral membrane protein YtvI [Metabacillus arenae]|uniref:Sporulation integral membrane protein YtvI n=1 Tax=Metabacillus arenae TaxID=2771434 RepID=A0A926NEL8_9BACI|nr:sporulation integral membrane protein YtvI [Metabacillus arenae]MBD1380094.1 sporulation integral membrane protein YtvI [Metabacillus arenae]
MSLQFLYRILRGLFIIAVVVSLFLLVYFLSSLTYPFIIALILSFMINPLVNLLEKCHLPRSIAVFLVLTGVVAILAGLLTLLIAEIVSGTTYLASVVPTHFKTLVYYIETLFANQIIPFYDQMTSLFQNLGAGQQETILSNIEHISERISTSVGEFIKHFLENIPVIFSWIPNAATVIVFSLLATFFISNDWYKLKRFFSKILNKKAKVSGQTVLTELKKALFGFLKAQVTLISITTFIVCIGLLLLRVEYALTIALLIGLVDLLPYVGTGLIFVPWIIYLALSGHIKLAIGLGILYLIVIVQRQIMEPKVLSTSIGLDPLATLISLFVGFKLIGFLGLLAGPIVLVIINALVKAGIISDIWNFILGKKTA